MEYTLHMGPWSSVFAVPTALVDRYIKLAGKEQLQVLLWMLRHGGEAVQPDLLAQALGMSWTAPWTRWITGCRRDCLPARKASSPLPGGSRSRSQRTGLPRCQRQAAEQLPACPPSGAC